MYVYFPWILNLVFQNVIHDEKKGNFSPLQKKLKSNQTEKVGGSGLEAKKLNDFDRNPKRNSQTAL